jgi:hypothetical protein
MQMHMHLEKPLGLARGAEKRGQIEAAHSVRLGLKT